ncbi:NADP-dependent oxidoreductase [Actinophytocola sp.]|uniref:NADP-dependent oxidoreductase n=1 Tax=Actinophytocola sp. TaxID=1872138 RepID=UPI002D3364DC|nr:NADP-dependent oxidoreductase [Actinophytocola sp.]HYQ68278.1 NADP-dependent oxidoreductase [Actinophytocola sp.]
MGTTICFDDYGDSSVLRVREEETPPVNAGEVRVSYRAIAVNPADWKIVSGYARDFLPLQLPAVPGNESAGVVTAVAPDVTGFAVGDEVIRVGLGNSYRAEANVPAAELLSKPADIDFEQAASLAVAGCSAYAGLERIALQAGETLLVHGGAGGVGIAVTQIATHLGAKVISTASAHNHEFVAGLGATPVTYGPGLVDEVRALGGVDAVFDAHGGAGCVAATPALLSDLTRATTAAQDEHSAAAGIAHVGASMADMGRLMAAVTDLAREGVVRFPVQERIPLAEAARAFDISRAGHVRGKLVLVP